jgi:hypothetical protein
MYCFHRRYGFGDKHGLTVEQASEIEDSNEYVALPIYMYDHSGQTIQTTPFDCNWDSGKLGFIAVSKEKIRKDYGWKVITKARKSLIETYLKGEVETYDSYIRGDVYGFALFENDEEKYSAWGFFGSDHKASGLFDGAGWKE